MDHRALGLPVDQPADAGHRPDPDRGDDRGKAPSRLRAGRVVAGSLIALLAAPGALAEPFRIATYHAPFTRDGPGILVRDLRDGRDPETEAAVTVIAAAAPDVLVLTEFDYDLTGVALSALQARLAAAGHAMPHGFARLTNAGRQAGFDLDGDGRPGEPEDAVGYGAFSGQGGMAVLSVLPIDAEGVQDFSGLLWRDLPGAEAEGAPDTLPLASDGHWIVPVILPDGTALRLMAFHAQTPVFDGPEDRNGRRNRDQLRFWAGVLDGVQGPVPDPLVLIGNANLDPEGGEGRREAIRDLLAHPRLQDPRPLGGSGRPATVDWPDPVPGDLRVSYVLPSVALGVAGAGVVWPERQADGPAHKLVWVDVTPGR